MGNFDVRSHSFHVKTLLGHTPIAPAHERVAGRAAVCGDELDLGGAKVILDRVDDFYELGIYGKFLMSHPAPKEMGDGIQCFRRIVSIFISIYESFALVRAGPIQCEYSVTPEIEWNVTSIGICTDE